MEGEIRYCTTTDGVRIAYCAEGEGPPLIACGMLFESFSKDHLFPMRSRAFKEIGQGRTMVRYDLRGVGFSQRGVDDQSIEGHVNDLEAVVEAIGAPLCLLGWLASVPRVILFASRHPDLVQKLVLIDGYARQLDVMPLTVQRSLADMARLDFPTVARALTPMPEAAGAEEAWGEAYIESMAGDEAARAMLSYLDVDVTDVLGDIQVPTLVLHNPDSPNVPFEFGQRIAAGIPDAALMPVPNLALNPEALASAVDSFLPKQSSERTRSTEPQTGGAAFRAVLFTDLVGHTEMMSRLGDERGREVLREHERITREVLAAHDGTEVKTMGDGFMASFGSVTKSVECAIALQRVFGEREGEPLSIRVGINAGEPIEEEGDLFGATVILASRIAAKADGGAILVADTVRGLCSGKGFLFADRGEFVAKGFEEPVRVSEVRWQE